MEGTQGKPEILMGEEACHRPPYVAEVGLKATVLQLDKLHSKPPSHCKMETTVLVSPEAER